MSFPKKLMVMASSSVSIVSATVLFMSSLITVKLSCGMCDKHFCGLKKSPQPSLHAISQFWEVGKTRDGRTSVMVKMGKTCDGTVRDIYMTDP